MMFIRLLVLVGVVTASGCATRFPSLYPPTTPDSYRYQLAEPSAPHPDPGYYREVRSAPPAEPSSTLLAKLAELNERVAELSLQLQMQTGDAVAHVRAADVPAVGAGQGVDDYYVRSAAAAHEARQAAVRAEMYRLYGDAHSAVQQASVGNNALFAQDLAKAYQRTPPPSGVLIGPGARYAADVKQGGTDTSVKAVSATKIHTKRYDVILPVESGTDLDRMDKWLEASGITHRFSVRKSRNGPFMAVGSYYKASDAQRRQKEVENKTGIRPQVRIHSI